MSERMARVTPLGVVRGILVLSVLVEGAVIAGYGLFLGVEAVIAPAADRAGVVVMALLAVATGVALAFAARAARAGRRGARSPLLVWQLMQLLSTQTIGALFGVPVAAGLAVLALVIIASALWPGVFDRPAGRGTPR